MALAEIDKAPFGWYHVRAIVVAGIGFFTDAYDLFAVNMVTAMLGVVYWHDSSLGEDGGKIPTTADTAIKVATSGGTVLGQVGFGIMADVVGRKKMYGLVLILIIFATIAQALSSDSYAISIVGIIVFLFLPDNPMKSRLSHEEKIWAVERLRGNQTGIENKHVSQHYRSR